MGNTSGRDLTGQSSSHMTARINDVYAQCNRKEMAGVSGVFDVKAGITWIARRTEIA